MSMHASGRPLLRFAAVLAGVVLPVSLTVAQPGGDWPMYGQNVQRTGKSPYPGPLAGDMAWIADAAGPKLAVGPTAIYQGGPGASDLTALNFDGSVAWAFELGHSEGLAVDTYDIVYLGNRTLGVTGFQAIADGEVAWYEASAALPSEPAIAADGSVFVTCAGQLLKYGPQGNELWQVPLPTGALGTPAIGSDGTIYVCPDNYLYAFTPTGSLRWRFQLNSNGLCPVIGSEAVYISSQKWTLYAVSPSGGRKLWSVSLGTNNTAAFNTSEPAVDNAHRMVFSLGKSAFYAYGFDGKLKWKRSANAAAGKPAIGSDGTVYAGWNQTIHALQGSGGTVLWSRAFSQSVGSPVIGADGSLYVDAGGLHAFRDGAVSHPTVAALPVTRYADTQHTLVTYPDPIFAEEQMGIHATGVRGGEFPVAYADFFADANLDGQIDVGDPHLGRASVSDEWGRYSLILTAGADLLSGDHVVLGQVTDAMGTPSNVVANKVRIVDSGQP